MTDIFSKQLYGFSYFLIAKVGDEITGSVNAGIEAEKSNTSDVAL